MLDLGAGTGVLGLVAAALGSTEVRPKYAVLDLDGAGGGGLAG